MIFKKTKGNVYPNNQMQISLFMISLPHHHKRFLHTSNVTNTCYNIIITVISRKSITTDESMGAAAKYSEQNSVWSSSVDSINTLMPQDTRAMKVRLRKGYCI